DVLEEERESDSEDAADDRRERKVEQLARRRRLARTLRRIDDADVARPQLAADARLLGALEQAVVNLLVALHVALEDAVIDRLPVHPLRFGLLLVERCDQAVFLCERGLV